MGSQRKSTDLKAEKNLSCPSPIEIDVFFTAQNYDATLLYFFFAELDVSLKIFHRASAQMFFPPLTEKHERNREE